MQRRVVSPLARRDKTFTDRSEQVLRDLILGGQMAPGERLNEVELASSLGISRGPLREAIARLAAEGLLTVVSHRGAFVCAFDADELRDLYELRVALEVLAVRRAAERASAESTAELRAMLDETANLLDAGGDGAYPSDIDVHRGIAQLAGNRPLLETALNVHHRIFLARSRSGYQPARAKDAYAEHCEIVDAITRRDADLAEDLVRRHLGRSLRNALALFDGNGESEDADG